jgi:DNA helicase-2/ATP-dependent DNA helicase PcrA
VLVDEFQDLTPAHLLLVRLLAGPDGAVFGVGDDDQTIYGYNGADPAWLIDFDQYFAGAPHLALEVNYRCPAAVVTAATNLLSRNARRVPKTILPGPRAVTDPDALRTIASADPVQATVDAVVARLDAGAAPADLAVLTRVNTLLAPVQVALLERGIPVANRDGARFLDRTGVAAALSWLRLAAGSGTPQRTRRQPAACRPGRSSVAPADRLDGRAARPRRPPAAWPGGSAPSATRRRCSGS